MGVPRLAVNIALAPWWALQLVTGAKSFRDNPVLGSRTLNRWGLHVARRRAAMRLAALRRRGLAGSLSAQEIDFFDANGYLMRQDALGRDAFARLKQEVMALRAPAREMRQGNAVTRHIGLDDDVLAALPECRGFVKDAQLLARMHYAASYRGEPTFSVQSIITDPSAGEPDPQTIFHSDTFHPTAKAWFFLTDVGADDGPFAYVPGSHRVDARRLAWEYRKSLDARDAADRMHGEGSLRIDEGEREALGLPPPLQFAVPANTLIIADTSGFHARTPSPRATHRVEIYATLRRTPFVPWLGGHCLALPPISGRHTRLHSMFGSGTWKPVGPVGAFDEASLK
jgi:hypothetical protein